jgi:hypothetical protein
MRLAALTLAVGVFGLAAGAANAAPAVPNLSPQ